ncbi:hypothetical protein M407DRAFT_65709 [Tulasnella calospora MUT 4182]|uniref:Macrofage activating glycoprotein n=1 Tax=Tulasnella calospora MUT 4182 TaxID=1051891 RepID=A0A0C3QKX7_9AGAM|nr:hypothetical protein M407DRAFT_65709 [Tulasnella calospora MUT 4182]
MFTILAASLAALAGSAAAKGTPTVDQALEPRQAAFTPLASQHFNYDTLPYQADTSDGERGRQYGYNICNSTTEGPTSNCQTAIINSLDDFCIWGPPEPNSVVGNTEGEAVAWCTKPGHGSRIIPQGAITGAQFMRTPDYIQITGHINQALINMTPDDGGGEMDPHGADQRGNPLGGLVFTNAWGAGYTQVVEWHNFMGDNLFCLKACDPKGPNAARYCEHVFDRIGCWYNAPAAYLDGEFSSCLGASQDFPGIYTGADGVVSTYTQPPESLGPIATMPWVPVPPASSSCTTFSSAAIYTGQPTPSIAQTTSAASTSVPASSAAAAASKSTPAANKSSASSTASASAAANAAGVPAKFGASGVWGVAIGMVGAAIGAVAVL